MKKFMLFISGLLYLSLAYGEIWTKPPYKPDENHLPKEPLIHKQAQEESPKKKQPQKARSTDETKDHSRKKRLSSPY